MRKEDLNNSTDGVANLSEEDALPPEAEVQYAGMSPFREIHGPNYKVVVIDIGRSRDDVES